MSMRKIAVATGVGLLITAGATGRSDLPGRAEANDGSQESFDQQLRLSESQREALQAKFRYWRAHDDDGYTTLAPPH
jgi:hypothetical protein